MKNNLLESGQKCNSLEVTKIIQSLNYAIDKIGHRTIYEYNSAILDDLDLALRRRPCIQQFWINEFSKLGFSKMRERSIE